MTRTIAKFVAPAALVLASFAAQAGEGPIQVESTRATAAPATSATQTAVPQAPVSSTIYVG